MANAYYWSSAWCDEQNAAGVKTCGAELAAALVSAGLARTADTGQVNWATVTVPGTTSTAFAYELYPVLGGALTIRIDWSTSSNFAGSSGPWVRIRVGTGSDGSGNLTGLIYDTGNQPSYSIDALLPNLPSFISNPAAGDFFALVLKFGIGGNLHAVLSLAIEKTVDANGSPDGVGYVFTYGTNATGATSATAKATWNIAEGVLYAASASCCLIPGDITNSSVGSDKQVFPHAVCCNRMRFTHGLGAVIASECPINTTISACIVGDPATDARGYVSVGYGFGGPQAGNTSSVYSNVMLWEP